MNDTKIHALIIASLIVSLAVVAAVFPNIHYDSQMNLNAFASYEELKNFLKTNTNIPDSYYYERWALGGTFKSPLTLSGAESKDTSMLPEYSTTNVQVEGVDEADIVKTDGTYIYVISKQTIIILKAYPAEEAEILARLTFEGSLKGVFINENRLAVFMDTGYGDYRTMTFAPMPSSYAATTFALVYDITNRANPTLTRNVSFDGSYFNSRMIGQYAYLIINQGIYTTQNEIAIPKTYYPDRTEELSATKIYYTNITDNFNTYVHVISINLQDDEQLPTQKTYLTGGASNMYVSMGNIYLTYASYQYQMQTTKVHRIQIEEGEIEYRASGEVPGYVLNQFSMDEYNGYVRIATTTGELWSWGEYASRNHVYVLDPDLDTVGTLEDLAPGERIYSARFMGNRGYLVTFKKIDPLFVIDLTEPTSPHVLGALHITGYSDYLHPYDENHIIGIGKETVEGEGGNFAWYQGVKISLFDVTDVSDPKEIAKYEIGDRGTTSPILTDHKAFLFDKERNLLVIPVTVAEIDPAKYPGEIPDWAYGEFVWDGAYVFNISLEQGLELRGTITHLTDNIEPFKTGSYYNSEYSIQRSLYIDNVLYTISAQKIKMNSLTDLSPIGEIKLNQ